MADGNAYLHPGVYIQELPGIPTISGVSTSIPVFVGMTQTLDPSDLNVARQVNGWADFQARYGGYVWGAYVSISVYEYFAEGGQVCYVIGVGSTTQYAPAKATAVTDAATGQYSFEAASAGDWADVLQIAIVDAGPKSGGPSSYFKFNVLVAQSDLDAPKIGARLLKQYVIENSIKPIDTFYVLESFGAFTISSTTGGGATCKLAQQINAKSLFIRVTDVKQKEAKSTVPRAGTPHKMTPAAKIDATLYDNTWGVLSSIPDATLVATPDAAVIDMSGDASDAVAYKNIITKGVMLTVQNAHLHNLFYVVDAPYVGVKTLNGKVIDNSQNIIDFVMGAKDSQPLTYDSAALFYPWPIVLNPISSTNIPVPASGAVLGCIARTDMNSGVHYSPAGVVNGRLQTATGMTRWLGESDQDRCNPHGINVIRNIPGYGITIYGARTFAVGSEWQYLAIRRFVTHVELSLKVGLQWVVFEPISEFLMTTVAREVTAYLIVLWNQGALFGATQEEAFFVTCDETNNTPAQRAQGILNVDVGLALSYPAEFVVIRIAQITSAPGSGS